MHKSIKLDCGSVVAVCTENNCTCDGEWVEISCKRSPEPHRYAVLAARFYVLGVPPRMQDFAAQLPRRIEW